MKEKSYVLKRFIMSLEISRYEKAKLWAVAHSISLTELIRILSDHFFKVDLIDDKYIWSSRIKLKDNYKCRKCGQKRDIKTLVAHHIIPVKRCGLNLLSNGISLCRSCHLKLHEDLRRMFPDL